MTDTSNLVSASGYVCAASTPIQIQGSFYGYTDGASCQVLKPLCPAGCCMTGTTVVDTTYTKWGCGLGMELNNTGTKSVYSGPVKCFDIDLIGSSGGNEVRIGFTQSTNTDKKVSPFVSVAAFANGWSGRVCLTDAECPAWALTANPPTCSKTVGTAGTPYDLQIQISAGGTAAAVGNFNVCVSKVSPVVDPGSTGTTDSCSTVTGQGTITDNKGGTAHVTCNGQDYIVQSNQWGSNAGQTLTYGPGTKFKVTMQNGTGVNYLPASFPSIFLGANNGHPTAGNELTRVVSSLNTVQTAWTWASNNATGSYNATYDVWFSNTGQAEPDRTSPSGAYLMVWLYKPTDNQPNSNPGTSPASVTIGGKTWNLWVGTSNGVPCYSYVAQTNLNSLSFDLNLFIQDAVGRQYIQPTWGLTNVFAGFEIWNGGVGLETTDFAVTVN
jgi:Glycosyl hydrolase family 12.